MTLRFKTQHYHHIATYHFASALQRNSSHYYTFTDQYCAALYHYNTLLTPHNNSQLYHHKALHYYTVTNHNCTQLYHHHTSHYHTLLLITIPSPYLTLPYISAHNSTITIPYSAITSQTIPHATIPSHNVTLLSIAIRDYTFTQQYIAKLYRYFASHGKTIPSQYITIL